ncbi:arylsulfatase B [Pseudomonas sp. N040]|uniref:arylsulfatase B n=1 Tax=Pseudomonas sp. N040 TaxID=2785325 RepID=UPI0018A2FF19|nr:arylsulfatase [Pseudomonas sp. N040]MBF7729105.1 arylsulfatase [Pseudomonas sp. N040]MBW7012745.1 arylsulfatase [Pseudomonas sp. N040]
MYRRPNPLLILLFLLCGLGATASASAAETRSQPNILFILADDLGHADVGFNGSDIQTPTLDQLAASGARLQSFYGQQVCTPARAALMTGRYPMRYGLQTFVVFPAHAYGLPLQERTLPAALKEAGYKTVMTGKWHLGHYKKAYWPQNRGFDHFYGSILGEVDYFTKEKAGFVDWQRNGEFLKETGYHTTQLADEMVRVIAADDGKKPLFMYMPFLAPHAPYQAPKAYEDRYPDIQDPTRRTYAGMVTAMDDSIARVLAALKQKGMLENTIVVFTSDNGGPLSAEIASGTGGSAAGLKMPAINAPLRDGKSTLYEGGVRTPTIISWPGHIPAGQVIDEPLHMVDWFPTLIAQAGGTLDGGKPLDGKDIWPVLTSKAASPHSDILINVEAFRGSVRKGKWKLLHTATWPQKTELYDLQADLSEKTNVARDNPAVVEELMAILDAYGNQQAPSKWLVSQLRFMKFQGKMLTEEDDGGLAEKQDMGALRMLGGQ